MYNDCNDDWLIIEIIFHFKEIFKKTIQISHIIVYYNKYQKIKISIKI